MRDAQLLQIRDFLDHAGERTGTSDTARRMPREAAYMQLIDDGIVQRANVDVVPRFERFRDDGSQRCVWRALRLRSLLAVPETLADRPRVYIEQFLAAGGSVIHLGYAMWTAGTPRVATVNR